MAPRSSHDAATLVRAEKLVEHSFSDRSLLSRALTHPSMTTEAASELDYERLEFLGDAVLGLVVVDEIYRRFPELPEGVMTKLKASLVSGGSLANAADELGLASLIALGQSELGTGRRGLRSALENVFEALVGALYLDGGIDAARRFVVSTLGPRISLDSFDALELDHPKSRLQEIVQAQGGEVAYEIVAEEGPAHAMSFTAEVSVDGRVQGRGVGTTKKEAEMGAAREALTCISSARTKRSKTRR
ncbi:MAG: ribonuclease III [Anaerosomatales bacterium]|nr:ribonuclease III [Anaerosomatales bacterium]MDT8433409.1 ribonuclease III [Anaerosomatales bacterium]